MSLGDFYRTHSSHPPLAPLASPQQKQKQEQKQKQKQEQKQKPQQNACKKTWRPLYPPKPEATVGSSGGELDDEVAQLRDEKMVLRLEAMERVTQGLERTRQASAMPLQEEPDPQIWSQLPEELVRSILTRLPAHEQLLHASKPCAPSFTPIDCAVPLSGRALRRNCAGLPTFDLADGSVDWRRWQWSIAEAANAGDAVTVKHCLRVTVARGAAAQRNSRFFLETACRAMVANANRSRDYETWRTLDTYLSKLLRSSTMMIGLFWQ